MITAASLRGDKEVVLEAVKESGWALMYASNEMKGTREVVMRACKQVRCATTWYLLFTVGIWGCGREKVREHGLVVQAREG